MTKTLKLSLVAIFAGISFASAQKIGHINSQDLMLLLPERKQAETAIQEYQSKEAVMTDIIKQDKVKEITDLETRIRNFQTTAQESLQKKEQELLQPMMDKSKKAIQEVAKEAGFKYILDTSLGAVLYHEDGEDIMPLVKKKLGLSDAASPSKEAPKVPVKK